MQGKMKPQICSKPDKEQIDLFLEPIEFMMKAGQYDAAYRLLKILRQWQGRQWIEEHLNSLYRKWIPRWHFEMLNDVSRGKAFGDALHALDLRDKTVLDIGAGSGILSMLAVRLGARHVYACEMIEPLAEIAAEIVQLNGMAHKITLIPKNSFDVEIGKDMPGRAEIMLSETIDCGFVGEGFLPSLKHAKKYLLQHDAPLVPCGVQLCGVLIDSPDIYHLNHVYRSQGFDVSKMNEFSTRGYFGVRLKTRPHSMISDVTTLIDLDLYGPIPESFTRVVEFEATESGTLHGVAFWFKVTLAPGVVLSNDPDQSGCHWTQAFVSFRQPLTVQKGERYPVELSFNEQVVSLAPLEKPRHYYAAAVSGTDSVERILHVV